MECGYKDRASDGMAHDCRSDLSNTAAVSMGPPRGPPGVLGIWGEGLFIFRELGSTANYFRGAGEQAHIFGDLGSTAKK